MGGETEQKRIQGTPLLHTFCRLQRSCTPIKRVGCVCKREKLWHQITDLAQHLVLPDAIEGIGEVQLENCTVGLEAVKVYSIELHGLQLLPPWGSRIPAGKE